MTSQYDLTGTDELYLISDQRYIVFKSNQVIELPGAAYPNTIRVNKVVNGFAVEMSSNTWTINTSDIDYTAISKAKLVDEDFNVELVKSITMLQIPSPQYEISVSYQQLEINHILANLNDDTDITFSPELLLDIVQNISYLRNMTAPITSTEAGESTTSNTSYILPEDITGESETNLVTDEEHTVNVPNNIQVIRPVQGAFFRDSLIVKSNGLPLVLNTDYVIGGLDISKTKQSIETGGVYRHIYIIAPIVGNVVLQYQAFGGEPTSRNITTIQNNVDRLYRLLTSFQFLTSATIGQTDVINALIQRITSVEERMRLLTTTGSPSYLDKTNGIARLYKLGVTDTNKHWFNIATLYTVAGSEDVITSDRVCYRIQTLESKLMFDVYISVNIYDEINPISVDVVADLSNTGYEPFKNYDDLDYRVIPEFRVIWNDIADERSGAILQIGVALKNIVVETIVIEDNSGNESCWILEPESSTNLTHKDNIVALPDGTSIWSNTIATSKLARCIAPLKKGYLAWAGSKPMTNLLTKVSLNHIMDERDIQVTQIKRIICEVFDRKTGVIITSECIVSGKYIEPVVVGNTPIVDRIIYAEGCFFPDDLNQIKLTIMQNTINRIYMTAVVRMGEESITNERFDLRHLKVMF